jgi:NADH:ubiquinone oxidoreductase subunit 3 (subunit A)
MSAPILLPLIFGLSIVVALVIYWYSGRVSVKVSSKDRGAKGELYACGEDFPREELQVDIEHFLVYAIYLLIFDVLIFMLATSSPAVGFEPLIYSLVLLAASWLLVFYRRVA